MKSHFLMKVGKCDFLGSRVLILSLEKFNWGNLPLQMGFS